MKTLIIALLLVSSATAQTRAQLKADNKWLADYAAMLVQELDKANADNAANQDLADYLLKQSMDLEKQLANLKTLNQVLESQNKILMNDLIAVSSTPARTVVVPVFEAAPAPKPQTIRVIHDDPPYQEPWTSPVTCSGYDIPTPGLTLTYQNCH